MRPLQLAIVVILSTFTATGCVRSQATDAKILALPPEIEVAWADSAVTLDGRLDEPLWDDASIYSLSLPDQFARDDGNTTPLEPATVRFACSDTHFYVGFDLVDRDVVQQSDEDQQHFYRTGDVAELFLKPADGSHYWEFYATPNARRATIFFHSRGRLGLPLNFQPESGFRIAALVNGSLNDPADTDRGWTAELALPFSELAEAGVPFDADHPWTVLVGRYNYSAQLPDRELSSFPSLPSASFHLLENYGLLRLQKSTVR